MRSFPLKMMLRRLLRRRAYTAITVGGLALGLVCCLFILVFVQHERSYDRLHTRADRIVRLTADLNTGGGTLDLAFVPAPWGPALAEDEAAVETAVRFARFAAPLLVRAGDRAFYEDLFFWADSTLFEVFDFRLLRGNPATALVAPYSVVLTEETAR
ncbi:MAG: ABC transporter permease, partial [Rhodothermales bacterium]|nr:ABC transporter permease [Rhodothermales bacterium]